MSPADASHPPVSFLTEAEMLAAAVQGVTGVVAVGGGGPLQPTTYLPGRLVAGIRSSTDRIQVAVTAEFGVSATVVADQIRATLAVAAHGRPVDVHIADLQAPIPVPVPVPVMETGPGSGSGSE